MTEFKHLVAVGDNFWNLRSSLVMFHLIDIGTHMSFIRLVSVVVVDDDNDEDLLHSIHHLVVDDWDLMIILRELLYLIV